MTLTELEPVTTPAVDAPAPPAAVRRSRRRVRAGVVGPVLLVAASLALWALSLDRIDVADLDDLGLVSVLPATYYAGLVVLVGSFCWTLATRRAPGWLYLGHVGALVLMLHGTPAIIEEVPRFAVTWRHAGITDYIVQHGSVDPGIDAYFNWPGFFILCAAFQELAGLSSMAGLARWGSLFFELLYLAPLLMVFRGLTRDRRVIWASVFLFYATNWIGQDYFSPQAESLFLFLVIVGIVVRWFPAPAPAGTPAPAGLAGLGGQRAALMATLIVVFAAIVPSHQLTPLMALIGVAALVIFKRSDARGLPTLMAVMIAAWVVFMTVAYLSGHIEKITGSVGVGQSVGANVNDHVAGSPQHLLVIKVRLALAGGLWVLGALGFWRLWSHGRRPWTVAILAAAPLGLLPLPYGGELLLRVCLFSLPFTAFLVASLAFADRRGAAALRRTAVVSGVVLLGLIGAFLVARYGNERMDAFTSDEVSAVQVAYDVVPRDAVLMAGGTNTPWKFERYRDVHHKVLLADPVFRQQEPSALRPGPLADAVAASLRRAAGKRTASYLLLMRSQDAGAELLGTVRPGVLERVRTAVGRSSQFKPVYVTPDAQLYKLPGELPGAAR
jgi:hypothetical protein